MTVTGCANAAVCQPLADSFANVTVASLAPLLLQSVPVWVPVLAAPL